MSIRHLWAALLSILLIASAFPPPAGAQGPAITIWVNGRTLAPDVPPFIDAGRTLVPMRAIFEALGYSVAWDAATQTVTARRDGSELRLRAGSTDATVNGAPVRLDVAPRVVNGRTFVPVRFVAEASGARVEWDAGSRTITIITGPQAIALAVPYAPETLDPSRVYNEVELALAHHLVEGLVRPVSDGAASPLYPMGSGLAESWTVSADELTWTFKLRPGLTWSDGTPLTARDFVYGWQRSLDPETGSPYAPRLMKGIRATDDRTLVVELLAPVRHLPRLLALPWFAPQRADLVSRHGSSYGEPGTVGVNGPFTIRRDSAPGTFVLERNPRYWNAGQVRLERISVRVVGEKDTLAAWRAGEIHLVMAPDWEMLLPGPERDQALRIAADAVTFVTVQHQDPLLGQVKARQALSLALDRKFIAETFGPANGPQAPAGGVVPAGMAGDIANFRSEAGPMLLEGSDPEQARRLWQEALTEAGVGSEYPIEVLASAHFEGLARLVAAQWSQVLGSPFTVRTVSFPELLTLRKSGEYQLAIARWLADYDHPATFLTLWAGDSFFNETGWRSETYDHLLRQAAWGKGQDPWSALYQAERLLMEQMVVIPVAEPQRLWLRHPQLRSAAFLPAAPYLDLRSAWIEGGMTITPPGSGSGSGFGGAGAAPGDDRPTSAGLPPETGWTHDRGGPRRTGYNPEATVNAQAVKVWHSTVDPAFGVPSSGAVLGGGLLYVGGRDRKLYALDPANGQVA